MEDSKKEDIRQKLASLAATHEIVVNQMEHMIDLLNHVLDTGKQIGVRS